MFAPPTLASSEVKFIFPKTSPEPIVPPLSPRFKIPPELKTAVTARLRQTGMSNRDAVKRYNEFAKWFKSHVRENKLTQKEYSLLADIFEDAGVQKRVKSKGQRRQSLNLSHIREHSPYSTSDEPGSGLNFLENWYLNQKIGNKK